MTRYERYAVRPILSAIEKHQDFLCKPENLPQLAKLGFMFERLWYAGRVAYGCSGRIKSLNYTCENNPKYELGDTIKYNSEQNENLVYDAWGMHITEKDGGMSFEEFKELILNGKPLSDFELKLRKPNKTFDEWVSVMTDDQYQYRRLFPNRRSVANYLLCCFGTGYGYNTKTGVIIKEASGADQDRDGYGDWENAKFIPQIQVAVDKVLAFEMTKLAMDAECDYINEYHAKQKEEERQSKLKFIKLLLPLINEKRIELGKEEFTIDSPEIMEVVNEYYDNEMKSILNHANDPEKEEKGYEYYPICNYSIITQLDENSHPSYLREALTIAQDIVAYPPKLRKDFNAYQKEERLKMIEFAKNFVEKWKHLI
jgi:rubrerythrin